MDNSEVRGDDTQEFVISGTIFVTVTSVLAMIVVLLVMVIVTVIIISLWTKYTSSKRARKHSVSGEVIS